MRASYHTHSRYCDGKGNLEDYVQRALELKWKVLGFSAHASLPFETEWTLKKEDLPLYLKEAFMLKEKYKNEIQLYVGLETDYIKDTDINIPEGLDYYLFSVHYVRTEKNDRLIPVDGPFDMVEKGIQECYDGDGKAYTVDYYSQYREMIRNKRPVLSGHLDLLKKNNKNNFIFNEQESWYKDEVEKTLKTVKEFGCILEINTGGLSRKYTDTAYPSPWIIEIMKEMEIPIVLNSDAHNPLWLDTAYGETEELLKKIGYKTQRALYDGIWQDVPIG